MSSIDSLKLTTPVAGETTYVSPITDLLRYNSLAFSGFYSHASLDICNLQLYFSTDNETFTLYKEITLNNTITSTGNELIPARYFKFEIQNPDLNAMSLINVLFTAHKTATSNIDVNIGADDIVISGVSTEATQLQVKGVLDNIKTNTDLLPRVGGVIYSNAATTTGTSTTPIDMGGYNVIQVSGRVPFDSSYNFVLQFGRAEVGNYFSDNIEANIKRLGTTAFATFSLTRTNVAHQFVRLYNLVGGSEVFLEYDLLKN
jgi:hypothetical protein